MFSFQNLLPSHHGRTTPPPPSLPGRRLAVSAVSLRCGALQPPDFRASAGLRWTGPSGSTVVPSHGTVSSQCLLPHLREIGTDLVGGQTLLGLEEPKRILAEKPPEVGGDWFQYA